MRSYCVRLSILSALLGLAPAVATAQVPGAPGTPSATVNGSFVTISWTAPIAGGAPTHYLIIASTTAGSSNLGTHNVGPSTSVSASLADGTYYIRVVAANAAGQGLASSERSFTIGAPAGPPGRPGLPTVSVSGLTATISWTPPTSGGAPTHYIITAGTSSNGIDLGVHNVGLITSITVTLPIGSYYIRVAAANAAGLNGTSEVSFSVGGGTRPGAPGTPNIVVNGSQATISWPPPASGDAPTHYLVQAGSSPFGRELGSHNVGANTSVTAALSPGTYFIRVVAVNQFGTSDPSTPRSFIVGSFSGSVDGTWHGATSQGRPIGFVVLGGRITRFLVGGNFVFSGGSCSVTQPADTIDPVSIAGAQLQYVHQAAAGNLGFSINGTFSSTTTVSGSITLTLVASSTFPCSGTASATWTATNYGVGVPGTVLSIDPIVSGTIVTLSWPEPSVGDLPTDYVVEIGSSNGSSVAGTFVSPIRRLSLALAAGTYFARVKARNASGLGAPSPDISFTTTGALQVPGAPRNLAVTTNGSLANFSWSAPDTGGGLIDYVFEVGTSSNASNTGVFPIARSSLPLFTASLPTGTYFARVKGRNPVGSGPASGEVTFSIVSSGTIAVRPTTVYITQDSQGRLLILGEVHNSSSEFITFARVNAVVRNFSGSEITTDFAFLHGHVRRLTTTNSLTDTALGPNQTACFAVRSEVARSLVSTADLFFSGSDFANTPALSSVQLEGTPTGSGDIIGDLRIDGTMRNTGSRLTYFNQAVFSVKDGAGRSVACDFGFVSGTPVTVRPGLTTNTGLQAGASGPYGVRTSLRFSSSLTFSGWATWQDEIFSSSVSLEDATGAESSDPRKRALARDARLQAIVQQLKQNEPPR